MALSSIGYDGTVDELGFAQLMNMAGARHTVANRASFMATQVNGVRSISLSAGQAYATGVRTVSDSAVTVPLPAPTAGQWHLVVLRRNWETNTQSIETLTNATYTTSTAIPTAPPTSYPVEMLTSPGSRDDQPLWWAWVNNGNVTVLLVDLRHLPLSVPRRGTAAERDAYYPAIANDATRNYLDGQTWENTEQGRTEKFYGTKLTQFPGWYPVAGLMPTARASKTTAHNVNGSATVVGFNINAFTHGTDYIQWGPTVNSGTTFTILRTGIYRILYRMSLNGNVVMIMRMTVNGTASPTINQDVRGSNDAFPKTTIGDVTALYAGDVLRFDIRSAGGDTTLDLPQALVAIEFVSPVTIRTF